MQRTEFRNLKLLNNEMNALRDFGRVLGNFLSQGIYFLH